MTPLMQTAIERLSRLPKARQEVLAAKILRELEAEERKKPWVAEQHWIADHEPTQAEVQRSIEGLKALSQQNMLDGISIKSLIEEGRI